MRKFLILPGAHKTASTHFQRLLQMNRGRLARRGIAVIFPQDVRNHLIPLTYRLRDGENPVALRDEAEAALDLLAEDAQTIVIADENMLGGADAPMLFAGDRLYPWGPPRLERLVALLPEGRRRIGLAVRGQAGFLASCYAESLHHTPYRDFEAYVAGADIAGLRWAQLVARIRKRIGGVPITLWRFEDYPAVIRPLLAELFTGGIADSARLPDKEIHVGLSARAIAALRDETEGGIPPMPLIRALKETYPKSRDYPGPRPWSEAQADMLSDLYRADMADISEMKRVSIVRPVQD